MGEIGLYLSTLSQKKCINLEMVYHRRINFDDFWQKYSGDSRIESACFSFHVGLLMRCCFFFKYT